MLARMHNGHEILTFYPGTELLIPRQDEHIPLTFCLIVAMYQGCCVLIYEPDPNREMWSVPGGGIEPGETLEQCARRELFEESCQIAEVLSYRGLFKLRFQPDQHLELAALFYGELTEMQPFTPNDEATRFTLWNQRDPLDARFSVLAQQALIYAGIVDAAP